MLPGKLKNGKIGYTATGSEAIDLMTRLSRDFKKKNILISFHGLNFGEGTSDCSRLAGVSKHMFKGGITPLISETIFAPWPYCYRCPFGYEKDDCGLQCLAYFKEIFDSYDPDDITGIIFEGIPANSGVMIPPDGYLQGLRSICDENDLMLMVDEVFSGFGKTGKFLAVENWGIVPDIVALGKSMGGGMPISAVATTSEVIDNCGSIARGTVGSFSGNDVSCMSAIATMEIIQKEQLLENASELGKYMRDRIIEFSDTHDLIGDIRAKGFMIGIELVNDRNTKEPANKETEEICFEAYKKGLLIRSFGRYGNNNVIRMTPHLITNREQCDFALDVLEEAIKKFS
jgi:4-aminobutyrate aminotransferase-like enzyme